MKKNKEVRSITIDIDIWKQFQIYAITINKSVSSLIEQHMKEVLKGIEKGNK